MAQSDDTKRTAATRCASNPLQIAILQFSSVNQAKSVDCKFDLRQTPKRYTRYGSFLVLGPTFLTHSPQWETWYRSLNNIEKINFFECIAQNFKGSITHIAVNAPIALRNPSSSNKVNNVNEDEQNTDNVMRSPVGLIPLYGDFGPSQTANDAASLSPVDFERAYWAESVQLKDIVQIWAPRWTMFSRGNISEKARILQDGKAPNPFSGLTESELKQSIDSVDIVDFYVGIGYFAFCYLARGVRRVWGWDLNGWSIEGLRRACLRNGWNVRVVRISQNGAFVDAAGASGLVREIQTQHVAGNDIRCVAFWGDNVWAAKIMGEIVDAFQMCGMSQALNIRHCNLGLLPTSQKSWLGALSVMAASGGWLHVHENAAISGIESKKEETVEALKQQLQTLNRTDQSVSCEHVERVKTYAPGVMHCVFDIKVYPSS